MDAISSVGHGGTTPGLPARARAPSTPPPRELQNPGKWRAIPAAAHLPLSKPCRQHGLGRAAAAAQSVVMRHRTGACPTSACGHPAAAQPWRYLPRAHCNRHMQSACCSGRNYLRDQLREMEVRTASSGARAYCTTSVLQHHDAVGVRVTRRTPEAAASWPNRRSCVAAAAGMALGPPTTPQLPSSGSRGSQRIWAREIPKRLLLLAFGRSGRPDLPLRPNDTADRTRTCSNMFPFSYVNSNVQPDLRWRDWTLIIIAPCWRQ